MRARHGRQGVVMGERVGHINSNSCALKLPRSTDRPPNQPATRLLFVAVERANQLRAMAETASFQASTSHTDRTRFEPIWQRLDPHVSPKRGHPGGVSTGHRAMGAAVALERFACVAGGRGGQLCEGHACLSAQVRAQHAGAELEEGEYKSACEIFDTYLGSFNGGHDASRQVRHSAEAALVLHREEATRECAGQTRASAALAAMKGGDAMAVTHSGHD